MITKLTLSPLDGFRPIRPSQHTTTAGNARKLSVSRTGVHLNRAMFKQFKGSRYVVFYMKAQYVAVAKADKNTPDAIRMRITHGRYYQTINNEALYHTLKKRLANAPSKSRAILVADPKNVHSNCVIFDITKAK